MLVGELIAEGLKVLRKNGWTKFTRHDIDGSVCALGALEIPLNCRYSIESSELGMNAVYALACNIPKGWAENNPEKDAISAVAEYNNAHGQSTVEKWFKKTAAKSMYEQITVRKY